MPENEFIPDNVMKFFTENPNIGRETLAKKANISISDARFFCKLFKKIQTNVRIIENGIAAYDIHYPFVDEPSLNCLFQVTSDFKPSIFILGGDNLDFDMISTYNRKKPKLLEGRRIGKHYKDFECNVLSKLNNILSNNCKKYFIKGNHEFRVERLLEFNPKLEGLVEIEKNLDLHDWSIIDYKEVLKIGHMYFTHGIYWNKYHAERNVRIYQKNIFTGHAHTSQIFTSISPVDTLPKQAVSIGCIGKKNPEYREDEPNNWINQFLTFYILSDGSFLYFLHTIIFGRCIVNGKLYDGNKK